MLPLNPLEQRNSDTHTHTLGPLLGGLLLYCGSVVPHCHELIIPAVSFENTPD